MGICTVLLNGYVKVSQRSYQHDMVRSIRQKLGNNEARNILQVNI